MLRSFPDVYGVKWAAAFVSPTYSAVVETVTQEPGRARNPYIYLLTVYQMVPPSSGEEDDTTCLYISSELTAENSPPVLGIFDTNGHRILNSEIGDWANLASFSQRALEIASELLATIFVEFEPKHWKYTSVSTSDKVALLARAAQGWLPVNESSLPDGTKWTLLKRPKLTAARSKTEAVHTPPP